MSDWRTILRGFCKPWSDGGNGGSTLGLAIREAMAEVERLKAALAKRVAEIKSLKIQNAYAERGKEYERTDEERKAWWRLVNDAERAIGMDSTAVDPSARSLVEWCERARREHEAWEAMRGGLFQRVIFCQADGIAITWLPRMSDPVAVVLVAKVAEEKP